MRWGVNSRSPYLPICHVIYSAEWEIDHIIVLRETWFVIIRPVLAGWTRGPCYCIRNAQEAIGQPCSGHFTTSHHLPDLLMTTIKDKRNRATCWLNTTNFYCKKFRALAIWVHLNKLEYHSKVSKYQYKTSVSNIFLHRLIYLKDILQS